MAVEKQRATVAVKLPAGVAVRPTVGDSNTGMTLALEVTDIERTGPELVAHLRTAADNLEQELARGWGLPPAGPVVGPNWRPIGYWSAADPSSDEPGEQWPGPVPGVTFTRVLVASKPGPSVPASLVALVTASVPPGARVEVKTVPSGIGSRTTIKAEWSPEGGK